MLGTIVGNQVIAVNITDIIPVFIELISGGEQTISKYIA